MTAPGIDHLISLSRAAQEASLFPDSWDHGIAHWQGVADQALWMVESFGWGRNERIFAFVFGAVHDCQRVNDGYDPEHGERAAAWLRDTGWMRTLGIGHLEPTMVASLEGHDKGTTTPDHLEGLGWDADRSLLGRVGIVPKPAYFSLAPTFDAFDALIMRADTVMERPPCWTSLARRVFA